MASRSLGTLTLDLIARIAGFQSGMDQAARVAETRSRKINQALGRLKGTLAGVFAGFSAGVFIHKVIESTAEAETAMAELEDALKATGNASGFTAKQLDDFSNQLAGSTRFSDEEIKGLQTTLLRFTSVVGDEFTRATELSLDLATALRVDLGSAGKLLGQALENPVLGMKKLRKAGVELDESQVKLIKHLVETGQRAEAQGILMDELSNIQGRAKASADTFGGAIVQVKNAWDDLFEVTGEGANDAKESLQEFRDLLRSEDTKEGARIAAEGVITAFGSIVKAISEAAKFARYFGEEIARLKGQFSADDPIGIQQTIDQIQNIRNSSSLNVLDRLRFFGKDGLVEWYSDADLEAEMKRLQGLLKLNVPQASILGADGKPVPGKTNPGAPGGGGGGKETLSEFEKIKQGLDQQIALYGAVGEAAKIRYQVEHGLIEDLTDSQGQLLIQTAEMLDQKTADAEATKKQKEEQESLKKAYDDQVKTFQDIIDKVDEMGQADLTHRAIAAGTYGALDEASRKRLENLAAEADAQNKLNENLAKAKGIYEETRTPLEDFVKQQEDLKALYDSGAFDQLGGADTFLRKSKEITETFQKATEEVNEFAKKATENIQDILGDFLTELATTGKFSFNDLLKSFQNMLIQMAAQAVAADIGKSLFGSGGVGSGGGFLGQAAGFLGALFGRDSGGRGSPGMAYAIGTGAQPEVFIPDSPGTFVPNADAWGSKQEVNINFSLQVPEGGRLSRGTEQQIASAVSRGLAVSSRRNG